MKSGGGTPQAPQDPTPNIHAVADANGVTPYGQASYFNPMYDSILPTNGGPAMLNDPTRREAGGAVPLQAQQNAEIAAQQAAAQQAAQNPQGGGSSFFSSGVGPYQMMSALMSTWRPGKGFGADYGGMSQSDRNTMAMLMNRRGSGGSRGSHN